MVNDYSGSGANSGATFFLRMKEIKLKVKPLSVNECWQGKRFKTDKYKIYEREMLYRLPLIKLPEPPYHIIYEFGFSSPLSDIDNPIKPLQDILQKRYNFDDRDVFKITATKIKVKKGEEYLKFEIKTLH